MKVASPALVALLATRSFVMADLWTIILSGGQVIRWSGADVDVTANGIPYVRGPGIQRTSITEAKGIAVPSMQAMITAGPADMINGAPILQFIKGRGLDGAVVRLDRAFAATWQTPVVGTILRFSGLVTSVDQVGGATAQLTVQGWTILLNANLPANLYQTGCAHTVYDAGCGLDPSLFSAAGTVGGTPTQTTFGSNLTAANLYAQGKVVFTSGPNIGLPRAVKSNDATGLFTLIAPLPFPPGPGDTFTAYQGCDNTMATCLAKFNNLKRFKGMPFTPVAEAALG